MNKQEEKQEAGRKQEPVTGSEHLLVGMKIAIPVLPSTGSYTSEDTRSCVNDDCLDLPTFANRKILIRRKSDIGNFEPSAHKTAALYKKKYKQVEKSLRQIYEARAHAEEGDKGVFSPGLVSYIFSFSIILSHWSSKWMLPTTCSQ